MKIDDRLIRAFLSEYLVNNIAIFSVESTTSTNDLSKDMIDNNLQMSPFLVIANQQTKGRGRGVNRTFYSPADTGVYMSLVVDLPMMSIGRVTAGAGLVIADILNHHFNKDFKIKWVNDIINERGLKVAGILAEIYNNQLIIGIGINLSTENFPDNIKNTAGSVGKIDDRISREVIISQIIINLLALIMLDPDDLVIRYRTMSDTIGRFVKLKIGNQEVEGVAIDIDYDGKIMLQLSDGLKKLYGVGEVIKVEQGERK